MVLLGLAIGLSLGNSGNKNETKQIIQNYVRNTVINTTENSFEQNVNTTIHDVQSMKVNISIGGNLENSYVRATAKQDSKLVLKIENNVIEQNQVVNAMSSNASSELLSELEQENQSMGLFKKGSNASEIDQTQQNKIINEVKNAFKTSYAFNYQTTKVTEQELEFKFYVGGNVTESDIVVDSDMQSNACIGLALDLILSNETLNQISNQVAGSAQSSVIQSNKGGLGAFVIILIVLFGGIAGIIVAKSLKKRKGSSGSGGGIGGIGMGEGGGPLTVQGCKKKISEMKKVTGGVYGIAVIILILTIIMFAAVSATAIGVVCLLLFFVVLSLAILMTVKTKNKNEECQKLEEGDTKVVKEAIAENKQSTQAQQAAFDKSTASQRQKLQQVLENKENNQAQQAAAFDKSTASQTQELQQVLQNKQNNQNNTTSTSTSTSSSSSTSSNSNLTNSVMNMAEKNPKLVAGAGQMVGIPAPVTNEALQNPVLKTAAKNFLGGRLKM